MATPIALDFQAGIQRDGTKFDAHRALDSLWCRWRLGRPRKMGGFRQITDTVNGPARGVHMFYFSDQVIVHVGTTNGIQQFVLSPSGDLISTVDRTPATFLGGPTAGFTFDAIYDTTSKVVQLLAHTTPGATILGGAVSTVPFLGQINAAGPLAEFSTPPDTFGGTWIQPSISGGIVAVQPFTFVFDSDGLLQWSGPNLPLTLGVTGGTIGAGQARISAQKVVAGMPLRGGGYQSPAVLFWTLSEVIAGVFVGSASGEFAFNTITPSSSILSPTSVIEYDGLYFWAAVDRFLVFNGTVNEVPNLQNQDWFFDNLTPGYEQHVYAFKVPRYGEIWWCAPMFGNTECSHACILNVRENVWYDTVLPNGGRSAAHFAQGVRWPLMVGATPGANGYSMWMHETGTDQVVGSTISPVRSYFETPWGGGPKEQTPRNNGYSVEQIEPDIRQTGDLSMWLIGAANTRSPEIAGPAVPVNQVPILPQDQTAGFKSTMPTRLVRLHVESNSVGSSYIVGHLLAQVEEAESRIIS